MGNDAWGSEEGVGRKEAGGEINEQGLETVAPVVEGLCRKSPLLAWQRCVGALETIRLPPWTQGQLKLKGLGLNQTNNTGPVPFCIFSQVSKSPEGNISGFYAFSFFLSRWFCLSLLQGNRIGAWSLFPEGFLEVLVWWEFMHLAHPSPLWRQRGLVLLAGMGRAACKLWALPAASRKR